MPNNLAAFFGHHGDDRAPLRVEGHDWAAYGIDKIYIIFITGRCGSTWLTHLLEDSGICGHPHELFNETMMPRFNRTVKADSFAEYFAGAVANFSSGGRFGFKIDEYRFRHLLPLIDFPSLFPKEKTRFFWMTRGDILDQAFSYARAKATGRWHDFSNAPAQAAADAELSDLQLWREIVEVVAKENRMRDFFREHGIEPFRLSYEQMTADRLLTVMKVMLELQCPPDQVKAFLQRMEDKTTKLPLGNKYDLLADFYSRYRELLAPVEQRQLSDLDVIKTKLGLDYDLTI